jgi:hypothetical protein
MPLNPESPKIGDPLSAKWLNAIFREVGRLGNIKVVAPLQINRGDGGIVLSIDLWLPIWIQITAVGTAGNSGKYSWKRVISVSGGTWEDAPDGKTGAITDDPAIEVSSNASVVITKIVRAWRDPVSESLLFQAGTC